MDIDNYYINKLSNIFEQNNICSNEIKHSICVYEHAKQSIKCISYLSSIDCQAILLASLLHNADKNSLNDNNNINNNNNNNGNNYENTKNVLKYKSIEFINLVIEMIELVNIQENNNTVVNLVKNKLWMLIPRYSNQLELIGKIGIVKSYQYSLTNKIQLFTNNTFRAKNIDELCLIATEERFNNYHNMCLIDKYFTSESMIDYYYDKLLRICNFQNFNKYLIDTFNDKINVMIDFVIKFGINGFVDINLIENYAVECEIKLDIN